jgi:hypothetical protein
LHKEIWKNIKGYEGFYQVSNLGRVKSLDRYITYSNGNVIFTKGKIINGFKKDNGYWSIDLYKNGTKKKFHKHRLVAMEFIPNPENKPEVNHKDENRSNNCVDNLNWCTSKENKHYGSLPERRKEIAKITAAKLSKPVDQYSLDGKYITTFKSSSEVERTLGIPATSIIRNCKCVKTKTCAGYIWKYSTKEVVE